MIYPKNWTTFLNEDKKKEIASVICVTDEQKILILRRSKTDKHKADFWDLPGGHIDPSDDSLEAGAARELQEEAGLKTSTGDLMYVTRRELHRATRYTFVTTNWSGTVQLKPNPKTDILEHDDYKWATIEEIKELEQSIIPNYILRKALEKLDK